MRHLDSAAWTSPCCSRKHSPRKTATTDRRLGTTFRILAKMTAKMTETAVRIVASKKV
jgi:hypothetical protein